MTAQTQARQLHGVAPTFFVADVVKAVAYYDEKLGFKTARFWGQPPSFAIPTREQLHVMLSQQPADRIHPNGAHEHTMDAYFWVRDADELHAEFKAKGANIICEPSDETSYGMREFWVRDLDGYVLIFAHDISAKGRPS
jgi:catechol 2,3-dioxygenase-like lactoylglutathione lyase family enzyme